MKTILKCAFLALAQTLFTSIFAQQITVGTISSGVPTLIMTDAQLTDTLSFVLNGATLSNSIILSGTDTLGQYYYIKSAATRPNQSNPSQIAIILSQSGNDLMFITTGGGGCTMECSASLPCSTCDQVIFEKCKRQRCKCTSESGGCNSSITFPD
ncbi:MAG: hypothetical protein EPGJADBJ_01504 [Saprospiraceae bacterium]|nr:hypothetical protein [Saprospiraceae bacterium]